VKSDHVWREVRRLRLELADTVEQLEPQQWEVASWCAGWRVRDVVGHLVHLAESSQRSMLRDVIASWQRPDRALDRIARRLGDEPVPDLAARLRTAASGRFRVPGFPPAVALGEVIVHSGDALRPLGREVGVAANEVVPVLDVYWRMGRFAFHAQPHRGRHLSATDAPWSRGRGPSLSGRSVDLLMLLANRPQVMSTLEGSDAA
jgi:uncharacterized protein (TIGR03083 family)